MKENYYNYKFIKWIQRGGPVLIVSSDRTYLDSFYPLFATVFRRKLDLGNLGIMLHFSRHKTFAFIKSRDWNCIVAIPGIRQ